MSHSLAAPAWRRGRRGAGQSGPVVQLTGIRKSFGIETGVVLPMANQAPGNASVGAPATGPVQKAETDSASAEPQLFYAKSPIVGTFYESSSPETPQRTSESKAAR